MIIVWLIKIKSIITQSHHTILTMCLDIISYNKFICTSIELNEKTKNTLMNCCDEDHLAFPGKWSLVSKLVAMLYCIRFCYEGLDHQ